ncbi:uncharacterized protein dve isoform X2 [Drosophila bipectinata]|uniref:uncharacterized protein dve isoform X2 n=1 Tax=Drosophila bipectinata TaxID=42026 RepID=UPI0038B3A333
MLEEAKSLPLHCVVESVHSLHASLTIDTRQPWKRRPNIETDSYVIIAAATPWSEIVQTALQRLGYSQEVANTARGSLIIKHWKPIPLEQISDNPAVPVSDIVGELTSVITLRIVILRPKTSPLGEIKDKLLKLLVLQSHAVLRSTGCPLDEVTLSQICRSSHQNTYALPGGEISDELRRKFDQWWSNQLSPQAAAMAPKMLPFMTGPSPVPVPVAVPGEMDFPVGTAMAAAAAAAAHAAAAGGAAGNNPLGSMGSRESLLLANEAAHHPVGGPAPGSGHHGNMLVHPMHASMHHHHHHGGSGHGPQYPNQKTRMRTSFDPEMELPKLQKWFAENPHPSRQQIQTYVVQLNALESRRGRKPLDVNNVVYWFKNARAAQKRAEMRGGSLGSAMSALGHAAMNGYLSQHAPLGQNSSSSAGSQPMSMGNLSMSHDYLKSPLSLKSEDIDTMSQHSDDMEEEQSRPNTPQLPLSLTTHERHRSSPLMDDDEEEAAEQPQLQQQGEAKSDGMNGSLNEEERQEKPRDELQDNDKEGSGAEDRQQDSDAQIDAASNLSGSHNNNSHHNNNSSSHNQSHNDQDVSSTPKRTTPKEEDDDLDMDEDEEDNENDASHLDEFRSPSPDMPGGVAPHKDQLPFPMVPNSMFSQSFMYMSHYIPAFGQAAAGHPHHHAAAAAAAAGIQPNALMGGGGLNLSSISNEERRKRNRTFIDPVTEVPKLEQWFAMNTHPSHNLILKYTEDLNTMPYRQKFPRLESKNVQFWFKNRRAKCKRLKMSLYDSNQCAQLGGLGSFVPKYEERD